MTNPKSRIEAELNRARNWIEQGKYDDAINVLKSNSKAILNADYGAKEAALLNGLANFRLKHYLDAERYAETVLSQDKKNPNAYKLLIMIYAVRSDLKLCQAINNALFYAEYSESLLNLIKTFLPQVKDRLDYQKIINKIKNTKNDIAVKYIDFLPEDDYNQRIRLLKHIVKRDPSKLPELISVCIINNQFSEIPKLLSHLPKESQEKYMLETLLGENIIESAKNHIKLGNNMFEEFVKAVENKDLIKMKNEIRKIKIFPSGYILLLSLLEDPKSKSVWANEAENKFPEFLPLLKKCAEAKEEAGEIDDVMRLTQKIKKLDPNMGNNLLVKGLIKQGKLEDAELMLKNTDSVTTVEKARIQIELWKKDKNDSRLKSIIDDINFSENEFDSDCAVAKAEAAFLLSSNTNIDNIEKLFAECIKASKNRPEVYAFFGHYMLRKGDEEKGSFLLAKAVELGYVNDDVIEKVTNKLIREGREEEAVEYLKKVDTDWSHQRLGLIYFRKNKFEEAASELQTYLRRNKIDMKAWKVLGFCYIALGRAVSAQAVAANLRDYGYRSAALESQIDLFYERPVRKPDITDPAASIPYMVHIIEQMRKFLSFGRVQTAVFLLHEAEQFVKDTVAKWGTLSAVLKPAGDFFVEAFNATNEDSYLENAQALYMRRAEIDKRGEAFADIGCILLLRNQPQVSVNVLRRALKAFPSHHSVWYSLGVAYFAAGMIPFARHCLSVAAKIAGEEDRAHALACVAAVSLMAGDESGVASMSVDESQKLNPCDGLLWEVLGSLRSKRVAPVNAAINAFEFSPSVHIIKSLVDLSIRAGRFKDSLGYALMCGERSAICRVLEANGMYKAALDFADDEGTKARLLVLTGGSTDSEVPNIKAANEFISGNFEKAHTIYSGGHDTFSLLGQSACLKKLGKPIEEQQEVAEKAVEAADKHLRTAALRSTVRNFPGTALEGGTSVEVARAAVAEGVEVAFKEYPESIEATTLLICNAVKSDKLFIEEEAKLLNNEMKRVLRRNSSRNALTLALAVEKKSLNNADSKKHAQILSLLNPSAIPKLKDFYN